MRSNDLLDAPHVPPVVLPVSVNQTTFSLPPRRDIADEAQKQTTTSPSGVQADPDATTFEDFGIKMPPPAHLRASMGCTPMGTSAADVLAAAIAAATAGAAAEEEEEASSNTCDNITSDDRMHLHPSPTAAESNETIET
jgi:hypothetical protein